MSSASDTQFGKYELLDRIAAGGMAEIFRARYAPAAGVSRQVVIKKILPHYAANRAFINMFTNEARIAMGLSHGNIAQVFDFGEIDGDYFLAMELVDGQPLSRVMKRARALGIPFLPPELAAAIAIDALKGLHYAHTRLDDEGRPMHIVHRDVSPQNVLLSYEGQIKLVDFGIARARNAGPEDTTANAVKGKFAYFAPEQARAKELDARTDVFAAGIVLYEMLTGQLPFQGRMMDVLSRIVRGQFPRPRELNPKVPEPLERALLKAMALEKGDRFASAEAFAQELSRYLAENHPDYTPTRLAHFLQLLFEEELVREGRPVLLPRDFVDEAQGWKQAPPEPAGTLAIEDDQPPRPKEADAAPTEALEVPDGELPPTKPFVGTTRGPSGPAPAQRRPRPRRFPWLRAGLLFVASVTLGIAAVLSFQKFTRGTLELASTPSGALVKLDGRALANPTPLVVGGLEGGRRYRVEVSAPGFLPWINDVPLKRGQHLVVDARLAPEPKVEPPPLPPPAPDVPKPAAQPLPPAPDEVKWPLQSFALDVTRHRLDLSTSGALKVPLDPKAVYKVWLSKGPTLGWGFYVVNAAGAQPGPLGEAALQVKGASRLFAFRVPASTLAGEKVPEETKPRQLLVQPQGAKKPTAHKVPGDLRVEYRERVRLTGLNPKATYELTPRQSNPPARMRPGGAPINLVVIGHPTEGLLVAPVGLATRLTGVSQVWLTLLDDAADGQEGRLTIEARELPQPKKRRRR